LHFADLFASRCATTQRHRAARLFDDFLLAKLWRPPAEEGRTQPSSNYIHPIRHYVIYIFSLQKQQQQIRSGSYDGLPAPASWHSNDRRFMSKAASYWLRRTEDQDQS
jgi:hypothetical protein